MAMDQLVHRCIIPGGDMAGNTHTVSVDGSDIEYETSCTVCGEPLVSIREVLAALYEHAIESPDFEVV